MKSIKKLLITAGICLQLSAGLYADNWSDAFAAFNYKQNERGTMPWTDALVLAKKVGTPEAFAVGLAMSAGNPALLSRKFVGAASPAALQAALAGNATRLAPVANQQSPVINQQSPVNQPEEVQSSSLYNWLTGVQTPPVVTEADVARAQQEQQRADAAAAAANSQALTSIVNSDKTGASLFNSYVDLIFADLQKAISTVEDAMIQQQVVNNIQQKAANMKATAGSNQYSSRTLGKLGSKKNKAAKKHKKNK